MNDLDYHITMDQKKHSVLENKYFFFLININKMIKVMLINGKTFLPETNTDIAHISIHSDKIRQNGIEFNLKENFNLIWCVFDL